MARHGQYPRDRPLVLISQKPQKPRPIHYNRAIGTNGTIRTNALSVIV